jgi:hypothetical protein
VHAVVGLATPANGAGREEDLSRKECSAVELQDSRLLIVIDAGIDLGVRAR